ncbi:MAG: hypothetical protein ACRBCI_14060 [Cellvibrionaceae bacterium]
MKKMSISCLVSLTILLCCSMTYAQSAAPVIDGVNNEWGAGVFSNAKAKLSSDGRTLYIASSFQHSSIIPISVGDISIFIPYSRPNDLRHVMWLSFDSDDETGSKGKVQGSEMMVILSEYDMQFYYFKRNGEVVEVAPPLYEIDRSSRFFEIAIPVVDAMRFGDTINIQSLGVVESTYDSSYQPELRLTSGSDLQ